MNTSAQTRSIGADQLCEFAERPLSLPPVPALPATTWLVAAASSELRDRPLARLVNNASLVLFRDASGDAVAMEDRCPHKNAALSLGRVTGNTIQCRYHGWRFDTNGNLVEVPCHSPDERPPRCRVRTYRLAEQDDWIWIRTADEIAAADTPPRYPKSSEYVWFEFHTVVDAPVDLILENGLDCSHTGFAHEGLYRSTPKQFVQVRIEETATGVRVETSEEDGKDADDIRARLARNKSIRHVDEVILPHTLKVDYWIGDTAHVVTVLICSPENERRTRMYTRMGVRYGVWTPVVAWYVRRIAGKVIKQDKEILESQAATIERFGRREFRHVVADQPAVWMQRVRRRFLRGEPVAAVLRSRDVTYKL